VFVLSIGLTAYTLGLTSGFSRPRLDVVVELRSMDLAAKRTVAAVFKVDRSASPIADRDAQATHRRSGSPDLRFRLPVWDPGAD
jgi:hypothetical protein